MNKSDCLFRLERRARANAKSVKFGEAEADRRVNYCMKLIIVTCFVSTEQLNVQQVTK